MMLFRLFYVIATSTMFRNMLFRLFHKIATSNMLRAMILLIAAASLASTITTILVATPDALALFQLPTFTTFNEDGQNSMLLRFGSHIFQIMVTTSTHLSPWLRRIEPTISENFWVMWVVYDNGTDLWHYDSLHDWNGMLAGFRMELPADWIPTTAGVAAWVLIFAISIWILRLAFRGRQLQEQDAN
jgi:hypothetical protein